MEAFPKIFRLGDKHIRDIFLDEVEVTEKIDGSQFGFGKIGGNLIKQSHHAVIVEGKDNTFKLACDYVDSIAKKIPDNMFFYGEYLQKPRHNVLQYNRVPNNHIILFGVMDVATGEFISDRKKMEQFAKKFKIDIVPVLYSGKINNVEGLEQFLKFDSILGGKIEGVVVKNYKRPLLLGDSLIPIMSGKLVCDDFKEVKTQMWSTKHKVHGDLQQFIDSFNTEARWQKALQSLREQGLLDDSVKDIGLTIKEIQKDITNEEAENIKEFLWKEYSGEILKRAVLGFPVWYKRALTGEAPIDDCLSKKMNK